MYNWILGIRRWVLAFGYQALGIGLWVLGIRYWSMVNAGRFDIRNSSFVIRNSNRYSLLIAILLTSVTAFGQHAGYKPVAQLENFKKEFSTQSSKINSITSSFTQEKILSALTEKITSTGTFKFKRNNRVRIEYVKPFSYLMVMNGDKMLVKDDQKESRVNVKSNKLFQQINRIMVDCIQGTILDSKDFTTRIFENDKNYLLEMSPVGKSLKGFFETIVLIVEKKDYSVNSIEMNEPAGDQTIITFTDKKLNAQVPDEVFSL